MLNDWGYETPDELDPILTVEAFDTLTGGVFSSTAEEKRAVLDAATSAVRNYCGWHVAPVCECTWTGDGTRNQVALPAMMLRKVDRVEVLGKVLDPSEYEWANGLIRFKRPIPDAWRAVKVVYTAGYSADGLAGIIRDIASAALAGSAGVRSESAGQISVSYNLDDSGNGATITLGQSARTMIDPYRLTYV